MNSYFLLVAMIFMHIVDDFYLQRILASMKQRKWWVDNVPSGEFAMYQYDYIWALIMHGFSWAFMVMLPIAINMSFQVDLRFVGCMFAHALFHAVVDDMKANKKIINLWIDQFLHMIQIFFIYGAFVL